MLDLLRPIYTNVWYVLLIALFFGGSIFVHELGHFLAARWRGLRIDRFSIGMGPKIVSWNRGGVEYRLSWIPVGGYVALPQLADMRGIEGEPTGDGASLPPISYTDKMIVSVAGALFNLLFAFVLACILWGVKQPERADQTTTTIGYIAHDLPVEGPDGGTELVTSPAVEAHLQVGDRVVSIDGDKVGDWDDISHAIVTGSRRAEDGRRQSNFVIERDGATKSVVVHPRLAGDESIRQVGIAPAYDVLVADVVPDSPAARIGFKPDDKLVSVDDIPIRNEQTYLDRVTEERSKAHTLVVHRDQGDVTLTIPANLGPVIVQVLPDTPADRLGLKVGDRLVALNGKPVTTTKSFVDEIQAFANQAVTLAITRDGNQLSLSVPPRPQVDGKLGIQITDMLGEQLTIPATLVRINPLQQFSKQIGDTFSVLGSLLNPRSDIGLSKMSGPVGIIRVYYTAVRAEFRFVLWLTILVNINLAIFNLLPIPVLDGGHMLFATISKLRGRAIPPQMLITTQSVFMVLLFTMIIYVTFFDVRRSWRDMTGHDARPEPAETAPEAAPADPGAIAPAPPAPAAP